MDMDITGYRQAIIHLAWFRDDKVRHLLFGMVELRPNELPDAVGCPRKDFRIGNKGRKYSNSISFKRYCILFQLGKTEVFLLSNALDK